VPSISATFRNDTAGRSQFEIDDLNTTPPEIKFNDFLDPNDSTSALSLFGSDGVFGKAQYTRAGGATQVVDDIKDGDVVSMT
jgi:hypothetical protein